MIGGTVSRALIVEITAAEGVPGLYNVLLADFTFLSDMPTAVVGDLVERNGIDPAIKVPEA